MWPGGGEITSKIKCGISNLRWNKAQSMVFILEGEKEKKIQINQQFKAIL